MSKLPGSKPIKILAIGDCNTAGTKEVSGTNTVPGQLAMLLEQKGYSCQIQNLGYTMSTSREGLARSKNEAATCDILLLNFGLVDAWVTSLPAIYISYYPDNPIKKLFRKLLKSLKKRLRGKTIRKYIPVGQVVQLDEFISNITSIIQHVKSRSPDSKILLWGTVPVDGDNDRNELLKTYDDALNNIARNTAGGTFLNTASLLQGKSTQSLYLDTVHLSSEGCTFIGKHLYQALQAPDSSNA
jgi:lysophospholipase L1-like esterase